MSQKIAALKIVVLERKQFFLVNFKKRKIKQGGIWMLLQTSWNLPTFCTRVSCSLGFCWRYHGILAKKCLYSRKGSQAISVKVASQNREECPGWLQTGQNLMVCIIPLWMKCKGLVPMELKICANACLTAKLLSRPLNHEGTCTLTFFKTHSSQEYVSNLK